MDTSELLLRQPARNAPVSKNVTEVQCVFFMCSNTFKLVEPPSEPREVSLNSQTNGITVSWRRSADLGGRSDLFYQVEHSDPDDFGSYITDTDNLNGSPSRPGYTVTGLRPYTQYCVRVTAHNGVSDQDPDGTHLRTVEECVRTDEGGKFQ